MPNKCFPRCHMTLEEHGLYTYASSVAHESRKFYLSGPKVALAYRDTGRNAVYRVGKLLIESGWFKVLTPRYKDKVTGLWRPAVVKPLTHEEWAAIYGTATCRVIPCTNSGMDDEQSPSPSMHDSEASMHDSEASMHGFEQSMHGNVNKIRSKLEVSSEESESESGGDAKPAHTLSDNQTIAGKIQARICQDFDTTANPYLLSAILKGLDAGRAPEQVFKALKTTKIEYNDAMIWKTLADNLPTALIQQDLAREREERSERQLAEAMALAQATAARELEEAEQRRREEEELIEVDLGSPTLPAACTENV